MILFLAMLPDAHAFRLSGHRVMTERAVLAEDMAELERWLWQGNRAEDTRIGIKWRHYSHYHRPDADLLLPRRGTSGDRVEVLWEQAEEARRQGDSAAMWTAVGGLLHHVQDMASPPHVVPVAHDLRDGFESWPVDGLVAALALTTPAPLDPITAHSILARETWGLVQSDAVTGCGLRIPLSDIWQAPTDGPFGTYGDWAFRQREDCPELREAMEAVLVDRLAAALHYSRAVLQFFAAPQGTLP